MNSCKTPGRTIYNIIFACASIPPVAAALMSIKNGGETWAVIQRGKTYSGIDKTENFHKIGFEPHINTRTLLGQAELDLMSDKVCSIKAACPDAFFNIYCQDATAFRAVAIAANARLGYDDFHIHLIEDGISTYTYFEKEYINIPAEKLAPFVLKHKGNEKKALKAEHCIKNRPVFNTLKKLTKSDYIADEVSGKIFNIWFSDAKAQNYRNKLQCEYFFDAVKNAKKNFETVMSRQDNHLDDEIFDFGFANAFALAALPQFTYWMQDNELFRSIAAKSPDSRFANYFCANELPDNSRTAPHISFFRTPELIKSLSPQQLQQYLCLMFGDDFDICSNTLKRTVRAGNPAPAKKLLFFQQQLFAKPCFASDEKYGIGGLSGSAALPQSYDALDKKYKTPLIFGCEEDYSIFLDAVNNEDNFAADTDEKLKNKLKISVFNHYIDYIFTLKTVYTLYGDKYDIILKGHPTEPLGDHNMWNRSFYAVSSNGKKDYAAKALNNVLCAFHSEDSTGRYIGSIPYTLCAENIAFMDVDITLGGLPTSSYCGFPEGTDILFVIAADNCDLENTKNADIDNSIGSLHRKNRFCYRDENGTSQPAVYYNTDRFFSAVKSIIAQK